MSTEVDQLFKLARESEPELGSEQFINKLRVSFEPQLASEKQNFDWILVVAALLASCAVFFATPLYSWLVSLPAYLFALSTLQAFAVAMVLMIFTFLTLFDWETS